MVAQEKKEEKKNMPLNNCKALILAGGLGTRLRALVADRPKPMAEIQGKPFLEYLLCFFRKQGLHQFIFSVGYKAEVVQNYFGNGEKWNAQIEYSHETSPLGTGGALLHARQHFSPTTFVANGDTLVEVDLGKLLQFHESKQADWTFVVQKTSKPVFDQMGSFKLNEEQKVIAMGNTNQTKTESDWLNAGLYCISQKALLEAHLTAPCSLEQQLVPELFAQQKNIFLFPTQGYFCDMGTSESFASMQKDGIPPKIWKI